jgi:hypothetical protein
MALALLVCDLEEGLRSREATAIVKDYTGRRQFMPLDRTQIAEEDGKSWVTVDVLHIDAAKKVALVNLPIEADSGVHRIWVPVKQLRYANEMTHDSL